MQWRWPVSKPLVGSLGSGLWEVRSSVFDADYRIVFVISEGTMLLLHAFKKKTRATPAADHGLARSRQRQLFESSGASRRSRK